MRAADYLRQLQLYRALSDRQSTRASQMSHLIGSGRLETTTWLFSKAIIPTTGPQRRENGLMASACCCSLACRWRAFIQPPEWVRLRNAFAGKLLISIQSVFWLKARSPSPPVWHRFMSHAFLIGVGFGCVAATTGARLSGRLVYWKLCCRRAYRVAGGSESSLPLPALADKAQVTCRAPNSFSSCRRR